MTTFTPTETRDFGSIKVEIENTEKRHAWRLVVDGVVSPATTYYEGILHFRGWCVATEYWEGTFPPMVPFQITLAKKVRD